MIPRDGEDTDAVDVPSMAELEHFIQAEFSGPGLPSSALDAYAEEAGVELDSAVAMLKELDALDNNLTRPSERFTKGFLQTLANKLEDEASEQDRLINRYDSLRQIADAGITRGCKHLDVIRNRTAAVKAAIRVIEDAGI